MKNNRTHPSDRQRRFFLLLPLLALPFLTLAFWALGGGKGSQDPESPPEKAGLNTSLPEAGPPGQPQDKLSLYEQARRDSSRQDSPGTLALLSRFGFGGDLPAPDSLWGPFGYPDRGAGEPYDPTERQVLQQLERLQREVDSPSGGGPGSGSPDERQKATGSASWPPRTPPAASRQMPPAPHTGSEDPEIRQLNGMLERILDIQHPERVRRQLSGSVAQGKPRVYALSPLRDSAVAEKTNTVSAVIHLDQKLKVGALVRMRLTEDVRAGGLLLPRNTLVHGTCTLTGERLKIEVTAIRHGETILQVSLSAFDLDGQEGLHVPGLDSRETLRESSQQAVQNLPVVSLDQPLAAQAAGTIAQAAKGLFRRKTKQVRVNLPGDYRLLLRDSQTN
jgi:hypothetical protein